MLIKHDCTGFQTSTSNLDVGVLGTSGWALHIFYSVKLLFWCYFNCTIIISAIIHSGCPGSSFARNVSLYSLSIASCNNCNNYLIWLHDHSTWSNWIIWYHSDLWYCQWTRWLLLRLLCTNNYLIFLIHLVCLQY